MEVKESSETTSGKPPEGLVIEMKPSRSRQSLGVAKRSTRCSASRSAGPNDRPVEMIKRANEPASPFDLNSIGGVAHPDVHARE